METIFHQNTEPNLKIENRMALINKVTSNFHRHWVFRDSLNFNFLYHLYSSKLEDLYNNMVDCTDSDFKEKIFLLNQSIKQIKDYVIE